MTFAPRTWVVGETVTAALMNQEVRDQWNTVLAAWSSFTPTWTGSGSNPSLGNGSLVGRYMKVGRTVIAHINLTTGSTTTYGTGNYSWLLPVQAANAGANVVGHAHLLGVDRWGGQIIISANATTCSAFFSTATANTKLSFLQPTVPETLAAGAQVRMTFVYEAAS